MALADTFQAAVDGLPPDWTQLELDLRIFDEDQLRRGRHAADANQRDALLPARLALAIARCATSSGTPPRPETVRGTLGLLDDLGIEGELAVREARSGRVEVAQIWGRPESVRQEFRRRRASRAVARIALLSPDLLFGSKVQGALESAGHEVVSPTPRPICWSST